MLEKISYYVDEHYWVMNNVYSWAYDILLE